MGVLDQRFEKNFMITSVDYVFNWARKSAIWPLTFGLACCAIEMIASNDFAVRYGEVWSRKCSVIAAPGGPDDRGGDGDA